MNPNPLSSLNHFTVPVGIAFLHCVFLVLAATRRTLEKLRPAERSHCLIPAEAGVSWPEGSRLARSRRALRCWDDRSSAEDRRAVAGAADARAVRGAAPQGHRAGVHGRAPRQPRGRRLPLRGLRRGALPLHREVRVGDRVAELLGAGAGRGRRDRGGPQLPDAPHRGAVRGVRGPPRPRLRRRPGADGAALLHQLGGADVRAREGVSPDAPRFRVLHPASRLGESVDVAGALDGWREDRAAGAGVSLNFIASADGRIAVEGRSGPLGGAADHALFHALRARADAVLVGAGTARSEGYGPLVKPARARAERARAGLPEQPLALIASSSLEFDPALPLLADPESHVVILTGSEGE